MPRIASKIEPQETPRLPSSEHFGRPLSKAKDLKMQNNLSDLSPTSSPSLTRRLISWIKKAYTSIINRIRALWASLFNSSSSEPITSNPSQTVQISTISIDKPSPRKTPVILPPLRATIPSPEIAEETSTPGNEEVLSQQEQLNTQIQNGISQLEKDIKQLRDATGQKKYTQLVVLCKKARELDSWRETEKLLFPSNHAKKEEQIKKIISSLQNIIRQEQGFRSFLQERFNKIQEKHNKFFTKTEAEKKELHSSQSSSSRTQAQEILKEFQTLFINIQNIASINTSNNSLMDRNLNSLLSSQSKEIIKQMNLLLINNKKGIALFNPNHSKKRDPQSFQNLGNTCYLTAATQAFKPVANFLEKNQLQQGKDESLADFSQRVLLKKIFKDLITLSEAEGTTDDELDATVHSLRMTLFDSGLSPDFIVDPKLGYTSQQDAAQFAELILKINQASPIKTQITYTNRKNEIIINENPEQIIRLQIADLNQPKIPLQEVINKNFSKKKESELRTFNGVKTSDYTSQLSLNLTAEQDSKENAEFPDIICFSILRFNGINEHSPIQKKLQDKTQQYLKDHPELITAIQQELGITKEEATVFAENQAKDIVKNQLGISNNEKTYKDSTKITLENDGRIDLSEAFGKEKGSVEYQVVSSVSQVGSTIDQGHYVAMRKLPNGTWAYFNDNQRILEGSPEFSREEVTQTRDEGYFYILERIRPTH